MTNYNTTTKIPVQLTPQQIGVLLGCTEAVIKMGYAGVNKILMQETIEAVESQIRFLTKS